jgi:small ubiquitin-related modifier
MDSEPKVENAAEAPINIKVRDSSGEEMVFRVKRNTPMKKIFEAYAQRMGVRQETLKFSFDGERMKDEDTPKMLEMNDNDQIDVFIHQVGGADTEDVKPAMGEEAAITIKVREPTGEEIAFKVKKTTKMQKIIDAYANRKGVAVNALRFLLDGNRINADDTPKTLELEDGDQIDVRVEQTGGL